MVTSPQFFIFGPERSGTTMLTFLISGQPGIFAVNDSFVYDRLIKSWLYTSKGAFGSKRGPETRKLLEIVRYSFMHMPFKALAKNPQEVVYQTHYKLFAKLSLDQNISYQAAVRLVMELRNYYKARAHNWIGHYAGFMQPEVVLAENRKYAVGEVLGYCLQALAEPYTREKIKVLGEKTPLHTLYGSALLDKYPESKALLLVRNPINNIYSLMKRAKDFTQAVNRYTLYANSLKDLNDHARCKTLLYNELIQAPEEALQVFYKLMEYTHKPQKPARLFNYIKEGYTGTAIDPARAQNNPDFSARQRKEIYRRFARVFDAFGFT